MRSRLPAQGADCVTRGARKARDARLNFAIRGYQRLNHILNTTEADAQKEIELEAARTR